jgi:hypothetical protein
LEDQGKNDLRSSLELKQASGLFREDDGDDDDDGFDSCTIGHSEETEWNLLIVMHFVGFDR